MYCDIELGSTIIHYHVHAVHLLIIVIDIGNLQVTKRSTDVKAIWKPLVERNGLWQLGVPTWICQINTCVDLLDLFG